MIAPKMQTSNAKRRSEATRNLAESDPRTRDQLRRAASDGYAVVPAKGLAVAAVLGVAEQTWHKRKAGERGSPLSHACEAAYLAAVEGRTLEDAGIVSAMIDATLKSVAMWPALQDKSTAELCEMLEDTYDEETIIQGQLDVMQGRRRAGKRVDLEAERALWTRQATLSERSMAILDLLAERSDYH